jgi:hypothetical protein
LRTTVFFFAAEAVLVVLAGLEVAGFGVEGFGLTTCWSTAGGFSSAACWTNGDSGRGLATTGC